MPTTNKITKGTEPACLSAYVSGSQVQGFFPPKGPVHKGSSCHSLYLSQGYCEKGLKDPAMKY